MRTTSHFSERMRSVGQIRPTPRGALSIQAPMHSSNGLTITCRPKRGWLSAQDFEALKKDGYGYNSTEFCKLVASRCFAGAGRRGEGALQDVYEDCKCVVTARAYLPLVRPYLVLCTVWTYEPSCRRWQADGGDRLPSHAVARAQDDRVDQARGRAQGTHSGLLLRGDG